MHHPQKLSYKKNEKDQQIFVILSMKGNVEEKIIKIDKLLSSIDEQLMAVKNYIKEK